MFDFFDVIISFNLFFLFSTRRDGILNTEINETPPAVPRVGGRVVIIVLIPFLQ